MSKTAAPVVSALDLGGVRVHVPAAYAKYTPHQKACVDDLVARLQGRIGESLEAVFVHRVGKRKGRWVAFGGYVTRKPQPRTEN